MRGVRGQFYFIAAIVVVSLAIGFIVVSNYFKENPSSKIRDLAKEFKTESGQVLDYGTINNNPELIREFTRDFREYAGEDIEIYILFGSETNIKSYKYSKDGEEDVIVNQNNGEITITVNEFDYSFDLENGGNFYFVISQEENGEKNVVLG